MLRKTIRAVAFLAIAVLVVMRVNAVLQFKYPGGVYDVWNYEEQEENKVDVLLLGTSHMYHDVNTGILWSDYGLATYELGGADQPIWATYFYLKKALESQSPELIILDVYGATREVDFEDQSRIIKNSFALNNWSDKREVIHVGALEAQWTDFMLGFPIYHERYSDLSKEDFLPYRGVKNFENWKGFMMNYRTVAKNEPSVCNMSGTQSLPENCEEYLRKIIELALDNDIEIALCANPYIIGQTGMQRMNYIQTIADEYDVDFKNFNYEYASIGLNFSSDFSDNEHLNYKGNVKFTSYFGDYYTGLFELPDRRGEEGYEDYEIMAEDTAMEVSGQKLKDTSLFSPYMELLQNENYLIVVSVGGYYGNVTNISNLTEGLAGIGVDLSESEGKRAVWVVQNGEVIYSKIGFGDYLWHTELSAYDVLTLDSSEQAGVRVRVNRTNYHTLDNGLSITVYDTFREKYIDTAEFAISNSSMVMQKNK